MSQSIRPLRVVKNLDSRLTAGLGTPEYELHQGASAITYRSFPSSNLSSSSVIFNNCNPPSAETYTSRTVFVQVQYQITFTGTCVSGNLLDGWGYDVAPRALPVNNSFKSLTVSINCSNFTQDQNDCVLPVMSRVKYAWLRSFLSETPTSLDNCQLYSEGVGSNANTLASVQNGQPGQVPARGGFQGVTVQSNTPTSAVILLTATEPLMISPLAYSDEQDHLPAFYNVNTFQAQATFDAQLADRLISISNTASSTFSNVVAVPTYSNIYFAYYSSMLIQAPPVAPVYPWHPVQRYIQAGNALASGASTSMSLNNIQLDSIPARMYLILKPTRSSYNIRQTDTYARINSVNISFGNRSALLANCDPYQLFHISKSCGVDMDFDNWYGSTNSNKPRNWSGTGSILAINPMKDLGLDDLATNGTSQTIQVQFQVNYTNLQPSATVAYDAYLYVVSDGLITIPGAGVCLQQQSITSQADLLNAPMVMRNPDKYGSAMSGGSFWSSITDFFRAPPQWAKDAFSIAKQVAPIVAPFVGLGLNERGASLVGGKRISKQKLLSLMR
jgi:hypothetical protein